jgi:hypothetical protein
LLFLPAWFTALQSQPGMGFLVQDGSRIQFRNELNSYLWQWNLGKQFQVNPRFAISLAEDFRSSMLKLSNEKKWKDDQNLQMGTRYQISAPWQLVGSLQSISYMDKQTGLNSDIHTHTALAGFQFSPSSRVMVKTGLGPKWDYRFLRKDFGLTYSLDAMARDWDLQTYLNAMTLTLSEDVFKERRNTNSNAAYQVSKSFSAGTADTLRLYSSRRRNDNYTSVTGDFESLRENNKGVQNALGYQLSSMAWMQFHSSLQFRDVEVASYAAERKQKSRKRNDQVAENALLVHVRGRGWHNIWQLTSQSQTQKYDIDVSDLKTPFSQRTAFITPNNSSRRLLLGSEWSVALGRRDSLFAGGSMSRFQYDTPDTNNFDDRDEWRGHLHLIYSRRFSPVLQMEIQSSVNLYHMVYIFGERSADNNWNRIIRLRPGLNYLPNPRLRFYQSFEVLANYMDYDFEGPGISAKSFVFRKFAVDDSLRWSFADRSSLSMDYRLQFEENGQLFWERWSERVMTTRASHWLQARLSFSSRDGLYLSPGFTVYTRKEWRHEQNATGIEIINRVGSFISYGPMLRVKYAPSSTLQVVVDGVRRRVNPEGQRFYYINDLDVHVEWYF